MKATYSLSHSLIAAATPSNIDLIINFGTENETSHQVTRRPLNLSLVIDRSGSMAGKSLKYAIQAALDLVDRLTPEDFLSVVIYDDTAETILKHQQVNDKAAIRALIGKIKAGGCTNLSGGWLMGCDCVKSQYTTERINRVLLLTDGLANVGFTDDGVLIKTAREKAEAGIVTTTLGFGNGFNEDLLIGMANAGRGNFYFIQSPDDATDVFRIEMESLTSVVAQNLTVTLQPEESVEISSILNNYRFNKIGKDLEVFLGDVYGVETKGLVAELSLAPTSDIGLKKVATVFYKYQKVLNDSIQEFSDEITINITVSSPDEVNNVQPDALTVEQASKLRIAQVKEEAIALADQGNYTTAAQKIRQSIENLKLKILRESFEIAEELEQLDHYAQRLESQRFDSSIRKEMRDQSYQALSRNRSDLKLRGIAGSARTLDAVSTVEKGVLVQCFREGGKLRIRVISDGYNSNFNVQFPRNIREEGVTYIVDEINLSTDGSFYRASGNILRLVKPGEESTTSSQSSTSSAKTSKRQKLNAPTSAADLETTDSVGDGVLVQCVKEGSKLRARVVSDGYNPNYNIRFPRDIREENVLYVVDEVEEAKNGGSYVAYGKIKRLVQ